MTVFGSKNLNKNSMKYDFSKRQTPPPPKEVPHTDCGCIDCQKSALYSNQFANRMLPFQNDGHQIKPGAHFLDVHANTDHLDSSIVGSYVRSDKPVSLYSEMGGKIVRVAQPNHSVGKITQINNKGNWLYIDDAYSLNGDLRFIPVTSDLRYDKTPVTEAQKKEVIGSALVATAGAINPLGGLAASGIKEGAKIASHTMDFIASFKWYFVALLVIIIIAVFLRIKG